MRIDSSGNVGIGTSSPTVKLTTQDDSLTSTTPGTNIVARFQVNGSGRDASILLGDSVATASRIGQTSGNITFHPGSATETMRIDSAGMVGINATTGAGSKFNVFNESYRENIAAIYGLNQTNEYLGLGVIEDAAVITAGGAGSNSNSLVFRTASAGTETERMRIGNSAQRRHRHAGAQIALALHVVSSSGTQLILERTGTTSSFGLTHAETELQSSLH